MIFHFELLRSLDSRTLEQVSNLLVRCFPNTSDRHIGGVRCYPRAGCSINSGAISLLGFHGRELAFFCNFALRSSSLLFGGYAISVGSVCVCPKYRGLGLFKRSLDNLISWARFNDVHGLYLQGIPKFYAKYGFRALSPKLKLTLSGVIDGVNENLVLRRLEIRDLPSIAAIYDFSREKYSLAIERHSDLWFTLFRASGSYLFEESCVFVSQENVICGYAVFGRSESSVEVRELFFLPPATAMSVLTTLLAHLQVELGNLQVFGVCGLILFDLLSSELKCELTVYTSPGGGNLYLALDPDFPARKSAPIIFADRFDSMSLDISRLILQADNF